MYEHPLSPFAQKVKIALGEKGIEFESRLPNLLAGVDDDFKAASPRGEVPCLVDEELSVFDSTIILEYIEDRWPTPPLLPPTAAERARVRMIEEICDTYYEAINWGVFEVSLFKRATGKLAEQLLARAAEQTAGVNVYLDRQLGSDPYFNGETFGWGDLSVVPMVHAAALVGNSPAPGSGLAAWLRRAEARPSVASCMQAAADSLVGFEMLPKLVESGQFTREYRDHRLEWMMRSGGAEIVLEGMRKGNIRFSLEFK